MRIKRYREVVIDFALVFAEIFPFSLLLLLLLSKYSATPGRRITYYRTFVRFGFPRFISFFISSSAHRVSFLNRYFSAVAAVRNKWINKSVVLIDEYLHSLNDQVNFHGTKIEKIDSTRVPFSALKFHVESFAKYS